MSKKRPLPLAALYVMQQIDDLYIRNLIQEGLNNEEIISLHRGTDLADIHPAV